MKKYIIFLFSITLIFSSCDDFLTVVPETQLSSATFFQTEADFVQAVNGAYAPLRGYYNTQAWMLGELHSDNLYYGRNILFGATENHQNIADFAMPISGGTTPNVHVLNGWRALYLIISRSNQILALIDDVEFDQASKDNVKGQALFLRAFSYFHLVRYFGQIPLHITPVAVREESALPLSEESEIFAQIESDLTQAVPLLPLKSQQLPGRVTQGSARTLLGDVYVYLKRWAEAEQALGPVISSGEYMLMPSYEMAFSESVNNKNNAESVFEIQYKEGPEGLQGTFMYQFMPRPITIDELAPIMGTINPQELGGEGPAVPTPDLISAYEEGDLREDVSIGYITLSGSFRDDKVYPYIKKYQSDHVQHNNHGMNWPVYRYAEVLLLMAEAQNEQGKSGEAVGLLNQVRDRAGLENSSASGQADVREAIFQERRVELAFENKRWFDIMRTDRIQEIIVPYGQRIISNPIDYYYPPVEGSIPPSNAFTVLDKFYPYPALEADLTPHF